MQSNAYFLAKVRFDTAENEPAKNLQNLLIFRILLTLTPKVSAYPSAPVLRRRPRPGSSEQDARLADHPPDPADPNGQVVRPIQGSSKMASTSGLSPQNDELIF